MRVLGDNVYPQFLGYGYLTALTQNPLIRTGVEMIASEMTEKGWKLTTEKEESREKIKFLESELNRRTHPSEYILFTNLSACAYYLLRASGAVRFSAY